VYGSVAVESSASLSDTADLLSTDESTMENTVVHAGNSTVEPPPTEGAESAGADAFSEKEMEYWRWMRSDQPKTFYCCDVEAQGFPLGVGRGRGDGIFLIILTFLRILLAFFHMLFWRYPIIISTLSYYFFIFKVSHFDTDTIP
jgi:hypothetical protein